jgi:hypothetical protein
MQSVKYLRPYQKTAADKVLKILKENGVAYLAGQVRTGKTRVAIDVAFRFGATRVLFITKVKAISSIQRDFHAHPDHAAIQITVINYEALHKVAPDFDLVVYDEAHGLGKFPVPGVRARYLRDNFAGLPSILLSGTPSPESYSQLFHQFWITGQGPWKTYTRFYRWAKDYVNIKKVYIGAAFPVNDYSNAKEKVLKEFSKYRVTVTQAQAGFDGDVQETILSVDLPVELAALLRDLKRDRVLWGDYLADTGSKLVSAIHQITSGSIVGRVLNPYKVSYIRNYFKGKRIAIFYQFIQEGEMLRAAFPHNTNNPDEFAADPGLTFIAQISSAKEGVNLSAAEALVFMNIAYSASAYFQARARSQTRDGGHRPVYWVFSKGGIEEQIYRVVREKENFTVRHYDALNTDNIKGIPAKRNNISFRRTR